MGSHANRSVDFIYSSNFESASEGGKSIARRWAFWKLHYLYTKQMRQDSNELDKQIKELRKRYQLTSTN